MQLAAADVIFGREHAYQEYDNGARGAGLE
jgi:hypothetical protein